MSEKMFLKVRVDNNIRVADFPQGVDQGLPGRGVSLIETPVYQPPDLDVSIKTHSDYIRNRKAIETGHREKTKRNITHVPGVEIPIKYHAWLTWVERDLNRENQIQSLDDGNLGLLCHEYMTWVKDELALGFKISLDDGQIIQKYLLAAKRGNRMYAYLMEARLQAFQFGLGTQVFFDARDIHHLQHTPLMKFTLTYDRDKYTRFEAWDRVSKDLNTFVSSLRKIYNSKICHIRSYEAHADGYPHVNLDVLLEEGHVAVKYMKFQSLKKRKTPGAWRVVAPIPKSVLALKWTHGFIDLMGMSGVDGGQDYAPGDDTEPTRLTLMHDVKYLTKDLTKVPGDSKAVLQMAILWKMRKQSFSMTRHFAQAFNAACCRLDINTVYNSFLESGIDQEKTTDIEFLGFFGWLDKRIREAHPPPDWLWFDSDGNFFTSIIKYNKQKNISCSPGDLIREIKREPGGSDPPVHSSNHSSRQGSPEEPSISLNPKSSESQTKRAGGLTDDGPRGSV